MSEYSLENLTDLYDFFVNAPVGLHIEGSSGGVTLANDVALRLVGIDGDRGGLNGRNLADLYADPDTASGIQEDIASGRSVMNFRARLRRDDGSEQPVVIHANPVLANGDVVGMRSVSMPDPPNPAARREYRRVEPELEQMSEDQRRELFEVLDDFFEHAPVALHVVGPDGIVRRANKLELESMGYQDDPDSYIGHHIAEFHAEQAVIDDMLERLVGGRPLTDYRAWLTRRDGVTVPVVIYSSPRVENGDFVNTRCFTFPISVAGPVQERRFGWPRPAEPEEAEEASPLTTALKRLAGRKHAEESLGYLAEVSKVLLESDHRDAAAGVCDLTVPFLADWCCIVLDGDEGSELIASARTIDITGSDEMVRDVAEGRRSEREGVAHGLSAPFTTRGGRSGSFLLARGAGKEPFNVSDEALAQEAGRLLALAGVSEGAVKEGVTV